MKSARLLIVGSGGREHALGWKLSQSPEVSKIFTAPGNDGMPDEWERISVDLSKGIDEFRKLAHLAKANAVDLAVIGPDNPLADGIADVFREEGLPCFGPSAKAARIEASKSFAKEVMQAASVPTARFFTAHSIAQAKEILDSFSEWGNGWVLKADGLALGKGVYVCEKREEADSALRELSDSIQCDGVLVIEERLVGREISWMAFCDGKDCSLLEPVRDHKRLLDHDQGPNTGGMGGYSPLSELPAGLDQRVREEVFLPALCELFRRGSSFSGLLFAGLMWDEKSDQFWVLEFNARFGDPETQILLPRMEGDLYPWIEAVACGKLSEMPEKVSFKKDFSVYVVLAAAGYPRVPERGQPIEINGTPQVFFAGVKKDANRLVSSGGRVLGTLGLGETLKDARARAYQNVGKVHFSGMQFRKDIGSR